ncbi:MAG: LCP family protein [Bacilli bacterium]|nr:LCP family protein [Bacilli bacterium]
MKTMFKKFHNASLSIKLVYIISTLLLFGTVGFFIYNLIRLQGIETSIRAIIITSLIIVCLIYLILNFILLIAKKKVPIYITSFIVIIIAAFCVIGSMTINKILSSMGALSKDTVIYTTNLITLSGTEFVDDETFVTGIINNETDVEGNILAYELINKDKMKIKLEKYDSYFEMLEDLYSGKIKGMFVSSNYVITYATYEAYQSIGEQTKVVKEYSKEMKNQDYIENYASVTEPFTMLVMGVDSSAGSLKKASSFNGDTLMLIAFNPHTLNATVFSIPRDTYVPIACLNGDSSKINSAGAYGTKCVMNTVQNLTGLNIDYYVKVDFQGVIDLVNALGGIDVEVETPTSKGFLNKYNGQVCESDAHRNMGNLICMNTGLQHLNGDQALAYARCRHGYLDGDFARNRHQQVVVEGAFKSVKNISSVNDFYTILDTITPHIDTNMQTKEMLSLYGVAKTAFQNNNGATINVQRTQLTGYDLTMYVNNIRANVYTFQYYPQSLEEIVDAMNVTLEKKKATMIKTFSFSANKTYKVPVIGQRYYSVERNETVPNFKGQTLEQAKAWALQRNKTVNVQWIRKDSPGYDETLAEGTIIGQDIIKGKLVKDFTTITLQVISHVDPSSTTTTTSTSVTKSTSNTEATKTTETTEATTKETTQSTTKEAE